MIMKHNLRKLCGEYTSISSQTGPTSTGTRRVYPTRWLRSDTSRAAYLASGADGLDLGELIAA